MTDYFVTYTMANKEDRDGYLREIQEKGIDELSRGEEGCFRYDYFYPVGKDNTLFLWEQWETREHQAEHCKTEHFAQLGELKKKYGVTADIQIEDR
ncbi:MAG: putative quinol monooxygenase [Lentihominibacter sp.]